MLSIIPVYALITHLLTFFFVLAAGLHSKFRPAPYIVGVLISSFIVSLLLLSDYNIYAEAFRVLDTQQSFEDEYSLSQFEYLYTLINYWIRIFTEDFNYLRFLFVFFGLLVKIFFLRRWGKFHSVSFIFYIAVVFYPDSYLLRSTLASSFLLIAFWVLMNKKPAYQFVGLVLIAAGFHFSALIALPIWFFRKTVVSERSATIALFLIFVFGFVGIGQTLVNLAIGFVFDDGLLAQKIALYQDSKFAGRLSVFSGALVLYTSIIIAFIGCRKKLIGSMDNYDFCLVIMLLGLGLLLGLGDFAILAERTFRLFAFFYAVALGQVISCFTEKARMFVSMFLISVFNLVPYLTDAGPFQLIS
ncbi:EpsG family protein [Porticoccaceae bacterium]|nr:EpsG family protein [Porticoccaceae bacterium]